MKIKILLFYFFAISQLQASEVESARYYQHRYQYPDLYSKITDNRGDGFEQLYGTRNMRVVLKGFLYRGGGNNRYHRTNRRNNINPLPNDGIKNLCIENFSSAVYLYGEKFETAPTNISCQAHNEQENDFHYLNYRTLNSLTNLKKVFTHIHNVIQNNLGPVYIHCWNGWHASGYTAATALIQFCDMDHEAAVKYWDANTDGNNLDERYEKIRNKIRKFTAFEELKISSEIKKQICF